MNRTPREVGVSTPHSALSASAGRLVSSSPRPPPIIPDHELIRRIGVGSYGEVWLARTALGDHRAVKVIYRDAFDHDKPYQREFEGLKKFEPISHAHESQVDIFHVGINEQGEYFYYIMELADDANVPADVRRLTCSESAIRNPQSEITSEPPDVGCYVPRT